MKNILIRRNICLVITLLFITHFFANARVHFHNLDVKDGLSQTSVLSIYQDELGRMWFGTLEGINVYDGDEIKAFKTSYFKQRDVKVGNQINAITGDHNGNIFFVSDRSLIRYELHLDRFSRLRRGKIDCLVNSNERILMAVSDSLFQWNKEKLEFESVYVLPPEMGSSISALWYDSKESLWIGTNKGLYVLKQHVAGDETKCVLPDTHIRFLYEDSHQQIWAAPLRHGIYKISGDASSVIHYLKKENMNSLLNNDVRSVVEDDLGNLWFGTFQGVNRLDSNGVFTDYTKEGLPGNLRHNSIHSIYKDRQGTLWMGSYYGGVHYYNPAADIFSYYAENLQRESEGVSFSFVGNLLEDKGGTIWICTEGGGLNSYDRTTQKFTHYRQTAVLPYLNMKCFTYDSKENKLYIGTHTGGLLAFDISTGAVRQLGDIQQLGGIVGDVGFYKSDLIVLSNRGLFRMNPHAGTAQPLFKNSFVGGARFTIDSKGYIWIVGQWEVTRINLLNEEEVNVYNLGQNGLGEFPAYEVIEDENGTIFLSTYGSGLYRFEEDNGIFTGYTTGNSSLISDYCYQIALGRPGELIVSTDKGIMFWDTGKNQIIRSISSERLLLSGLNEDNGLLACENGDVFVGGINGLTVFNENQIKAPKPYNLYFSSLYVNNELVVPNESDALNQAIPFINRLQLKYDQNNIMIRFSSNNYCGGFNESEYEYMLEGFDKTWVTSSSRNITYTNLNPGTYRLVVREKNQNELEQSSHTIRMEIVVNRPWFASWWAYLIYFSLIGVICYFIYRNWKSKLALKLSLDSERREREKDEEINQEKLRFFANISHELRTPLTLIIAQIELLLQNSNVNKSIGQRLTKIYKTTFQLRELVSELLDFRKMERGGIRLRVSEFNIVELVQATLKAFAAQAVLKGIKLQLQTSSEAILCWGDVSQLRKVFNNLLSNAIKYSPEQSNVMIHVEESEQEISIKVIDNGIGIAPESLVKVFDRFYQAGNGQNTDVQGTGIGLALTKGLVELHHGLIEVRSQLGYGSIFIVTLKKGKAHFKEEEFLMAEAETSGQKEHHSFVIDDYVQDTEITTTGDETESGENMIKDVDGGKASILIVEDNDELLQLLAEVFSSTFRVTIAMNGKEGLKKAGEEKPDLILSDIMMPEMSGIEMCTKIKNNFELCHIPVVLLTALTSDEKNLEGLQCGADDYINKPFNMKLLLSRCCNLIRNRMLIHQKYTDNLYKDGVQDKFQDITMNSIDKEFLARLNEIVEKHIAEPEFDTTILAQEVGVSRSSLYGKLKALCGMTPNDYIQSIKVKKAAYMLKNNKELQISEIAYMLGFNTLRSFRNIIKIQLGKTPQEFRNE